MSSMAASMVTFIASSSLVFAVRLGLAFTSTSLCKEEEEEEKKEREDKERNPWDSEA